MVVYVRGVVVLSVLGGCAVRGDGDGDGMGRTIEEAAEAEEYHFKLGRQVFEGRRVFFRVDGVWEGDLDVCGNDKLVLRWRIW